MKAKELLLNLDACYAALSWARDKTIQEAWDTCHRGDWMLWFYQKQFPENIKELALAKGHCANTVRHLMRDPRSLVAIDTAIAFGEGRLAADELKTYAAAEAAAAAYTAAEAAAYAAASAYAYTAAYDDAYTAARDKNRQQTADICRKYLTLGEYK